MLAGAKVRSWRTAEPQPEAMQTRRRRLLAHRQQAIKLNSMGKRPGYTMVPLELYINDKGLIKLQIAVVKGKKQFEKKNKIKARDLERQMQADLKDLRYNG
jgi:SsrA-binding protein